MPVFPKPVTPFVIEPPLTLTDKGTPTSSCLKDAARCMDLIKDERHLVAQDLHADVVRRLEEWQRGLEVRAKEKKKRGVTTRLMTKQQKALLAARADRDLEMAQCKDYLQQHKATFEKLQHRCRLFRRAQENLNKDEDWTFASSNFGAKTYYRREDDGSLSVKLEGDLDGVPLFEQICVLKEIDLHHSWVPFCPSSMTIADLDKLDTVGWGIMGLPMFGFVRDCCYRAIGCDNFSYDGSFLLVGQGINDVLPGKPKAADDTYLQDDPMIGKLDIPPIPKRLGTSRITLRMFQAVIHVNSPTSYRTRIVANANPNISVLPQALLEFFMKQMAGVLLAKIQATAKKVPKYPATNVHAQKMRDERDFYQGWLMAKFRGICQEKGWEMPSVAAFEVSEEEIQQAKQQRRGTRRSVTFSDAVKKQNNNNHSNPSSPTNGGVLENMSLVDNNHHRAMTSTSDNDTISELSTKSGSTLWRNNPLASYIREMQEKTAKRKQQAIRETRERAHQRLVPHELPADQQSRLVELQVAKARRLAQTNNNKKSSRSQEDSSVIYIPETERLTLSQRLTETLHSHGAVTRTVVVTVLILLLFGLLHPQVMLRLLPQQEEDDDANDAATTTRTLWWWTTVLVNDLAAVVYISMCAVLHFMLCDVALVYAFDSLELGQKTGSKVKRFYSDNVRFGVALASLTAVAISVGMALLKVWLRALFWGLHKSALTLSHYARDAIDKARTMIVVPPSMQETVTKLVSGTVGLVRTLTGWTVWMGRPIVRVLYTLLIASNPIGHFIESLYQSLTDLVYSMAGAAVHFFESSMDRTTVISWRMEAFRTVSVFFSYTAVFLLTVLVLFYISTRGARVHPPKKSKQQQGAPKKEQEGDEGAISNGYLSPVPEEDEEEEEEEEDVFVSAISHDNQAVPQPPAAIINNNAFEEDLSTVSSRRRRGLRFRRPNKDVMEQNPRLKKYPTY